MVALLWKTVWQSLKMLNMSYHMTHYCTPRHISKRNENRCQYENLHMNFHSSIVHIRQKVEIKQTMNRSGKCGLSLWWGIIQPRKGMRY